MPTSSERQSLPVFVTTWWPSFKQKLNQPLFAAARVRDLTPSEESVWLRVFVQLLVTVGIVATDLAASTQNAVWAVPLSALGAAWSWRQRRRRNTVAKVGIAAGMLVVLFLFLGRLIGQLGDTRIMLAELLIQLQVLHTFDLPRRKDLGYSAVIGVILLGVAATVSETTAFGGLLLLFLVLALPVLVLDYRSRLGFVAVRLRQVDLAPRRFGLILVTVLALGLMIFALIPRLPGYQLRTFPVSAPIEIDGEFDPQAIVNPGYNRTDETSENGQGGRSADATFGEGGEQTTFNSRFYYGFNQEIDQNLGGTLEPEVVMRVRSQAEGFWRVMAFDEYTGRGWRLSRNEQAEKLRRSSWNYRFRIPSLTPLGPSREVVQTYSIVTDFPNLIPALNQPRHVYFPTREIAHDPEGTLRSPVPLDEGLTYTVVSDVPYRDRTRLGQTPNEYPADIRQVYLQLPPDMAARVSQQAQTLLAQAETPITAPYEQALFLTQALKQNYSLQPDLPPLAEDADLVESFLFASGGGYVDHFPTVLTVMLRSIGIPARLVTGFSPGQFNPFTGMYVVKNTDAHAITEVYFPGYGWFGFDPIPGHDLIPPSIEVDQTFSVLRQFWHWVAGWLPSPVTSFFAGLFGTLALLVARLLRLFSGGWEGMVSGLMLLLGLVLTLWLLWQGWRSWRRHRWLASLPPMERLYQQMLDRLAERGLSKRPQQTPLEYLGQVVRTTPSATATAVDEISQAYVAWRYGGQPANLPHLRQLLHRLRQRQR